MKKLLTIIRATTAAVILSSCNPLTDEAKEITGNYYLDEVSDDLPLMELNDDGTCLVRAIRPEVLTFSVEGTWNVLDDSLKISLDPSTLKWTGDSTLIGDIPVSLDKKLIRHSNISIEVENDGISYIYQRKK